MITRETLLNAIAMGHGGEFPYTCTYASGTTFTVAGDWTTVFLKGLKIEITNGGEKRYGYVTGSTYSNPNTTVTVTTLNDASGNIESIANGAITGVYIGSGELLRSHPLWINYTSSYTGYSSNPFEVTRFCVIGQTCFFVIVTTATTSNATTITYTTPITSRTVTSLGWGGACRFAFDNGAALTGAARWSLPNNSSTISVLKDMASGAWTASGTKRADINGFYEI